MEVGMFNVRRLGLFLFAAGILSVALMVGCSDNEGISGSVHQTPVTGVEAYFPLTDNYTTTYLVTNPNGTSQSMRCEVGAETDFQHETAVPWLSHSEDGTSTVYFRSSSSALYYYSSLNASSEKLLDLPLTVGKSWYRDAEYVDDTTSIISGFEDGRFGIIDDDDLPFLISFPITGTTFMTVASKGPLELNTGLHFTEAIEITSDNAGTGTTNHSWFVAGIGLVKWAKGVRNGEVSSASETGELTRYGF
jgi:hypothetical protein